MFLILDTILITSSIAKNNNPDNIVGVDIDKTHGLATWWKSYVNQNHYNLINFMNFFRSYFEPEAIPSL